MMTKSEDLGARVFDLVRSTPSMMECVTMMGEMLAVIEVLEADNQRLLAICESQKAYIYEVENEKGLDPVPQTQNNIRSTARSPVGGAEESPVRQKPATVLQLSAFRSRRESREAEPATSVPAPEGDN